MSRIRAVCDPKHDRLEGGTRGVAAAAYILAGRELGDSNIQKDAQLLLKSVGVEDRWPAGNQKASRQHHDRFGHFIETGQSVAAEYLKPASTRMPP